MSTTTKQQPDGKWGVVLDTGDLLADDFATEADARDFAESFERVSAHSDRVDADPSEPHEWTEPTRVQLDKGSRKSGECAACGEVRADDVHQPPAEVDPTVDDAAENPYADVLAQFDFDRYSNNTLIRAFASLTRQLERAEGLDRRSDLRQRRGLVEDEMLLRMSGRRPTCPEHGMPILWEEGGVDKPTMLGRSYCPECQGALMEFLATYGRPGVDTPPPVG